MTIITELALPIATTYFVGRTGKKNLAASGLGNMWCNAFGASIQVGLAMGLDSLAPHAFGGKENKLVGLYCQRSMVIVSAACIPIAIIWILAGVGLQYVFRIDEEMSHLAALWVWYRLPSLWPYGIFDCYRRYLLAQNVAWPISLTCTVVFVIHVFLTDRMVAEYDYIGASIAITISTWLMLFLLIAIVHIRDYFSPSDPSENCWPPFDWPEVRKGCTHYFQFAFPSALSLFLEWGGYEIYTSFVAQLGQTELAANAILGPATAGLWYVLPFGESIAASTLMGNALGSRMHGTAKQMAVLAYLVAILYALVNGLCALFYWDSWSRLWTNDEEVITMLTSMLYVMWAYSFMDSLKCAGMTLLRGVGRTSLTVWGNVVAQVAVGYPISYFLSHSLGLHGVWIGMTTAWGVCGFYYLFVMLRVDWPSEVEKTQREISIGKGEVVCSDSAPLLWGGHDVSDDEEALPMTYVELKEFLKDGLELGSSESEISDHVSDDEE